MTLEGIKQCLPAVERELPSSNALGIGGGDALCDIGAAFEAES